MPSGRNRPGYTPKVAGSTNKPSTAKAPAEGASAGKTPTGKTPTGKTSTGKTSTGKTPTGKTPTRKTPTGKTPTGKAGTRRAPVAKVDTLKPGSGTERSVADSRQAEHEWAQNQRATGRGRFAPVTAWLSRLFGKRTATVLAIVALVAALLALLVTLRPGAGDNVSDDNAAFVNRGETTELISQASAKVCDAIAADGTDFDAWADRARGVLTGPALEEFNDYLPDQRKLLAQTRMVAECRAESVGVRQLTFGEGGPRARVVVAFVISNSVNDMTLNSGTPHAELIMEKHGQQWLIAGIEDMGAGSSVDGQVEGQPGDQPEGQPEGEPEGQRPGG